MEYPDGEKEYAIQFFEIDPSAFVNEMSKDACDRVGISLQVMKQYFMKKLPGTFAQSEIDVAFEKVFKHYQINIEKIFEKVGSYVSARILRIPKHVLLPEDEPWDGESSSGVEARLHAVYTDMSTMRDTVKSALYKKAVLTEELRKMRCIRQAQESTIEEDRKLFAKHSIEAVPEVFDIISQKTKHVEFKSKELTDLSSEVLNDEVLELPSSLLNGRKRLLVRDHQKLYLEKLKFRQS